MLWLSYYSESDRVAVVLIGPESYIQAPVFVSGEVLWVGDWGIVDRAHVDRNGSNRGISFAVVGDKGKAIRPEVVRCWSVGEGRRRAGKRSVGRISHNMESQGRAIDIRAGEDDLSRCIFFCVTLWLSAVGASLT